MHGQPRTQHGRTRCKHRRRRRHQRRHRYVLKKNTPTHKMHVHTRARARARAHTHTPTYDTKMLWRTNSNLAFLERWKGNGCALKSRSSAHALQIVVGMHTCLCICVRGKNGWDSDRVALCVQVACERVGFKSSCARVFLCEVFVCAFGMHMQIWRFQGFDRTMISYFLSWCIIHCQIHHIHIIHTKLIHDLHLPNSGFRGKNS